MLARAHVADRAGLLAVAGQAGGRQRVERHALGRRRRGRVWLTPARRYIPWSVRTWRSSPEWELAMIAISAGSSSNASIPPASSRATSAERLDARAEGDDPIRVAEQADDPAGRVDLDDVAPMDALLDAVADLPDEDRGSARGGWARRPRPAVGAGRGAAARVAGTLGSVLRSRLAEGEDTAPGGRGYGGPDCYDAGTRRVRPGGARRPRGRPSRPRRPCTSRPIRRCSTSSRSCATSTTEPKKFREVVRELSWLLGYEALADARVRPLDDRDAARGDGRRTSWPTGSGSCRSCAPASAWSTRCSS